MLCNKSFAIWLVFLSVCIHVQADAVDIAIGSMSLDQKVAQMFVMSFYGPTLNQPARDLLSNWQPGAVVLLPSNLENPQQITRLTNDIQQTLIANGGVPAFIAADQEGGIIAHLDEGFTRWPVPTLLTATQDTGLAYQYGEALATELRAVGLNMNLAPVADLLTNRENPIIGRRSFGTDPQQVAPIVSAVVAGMQSEGVMATAKHFPGHGDTATDSHLSMPVLPFDLAELESRELVPFRAAIAANVGAVMVSHIAFPQLQSDDTLPASLSPDIVTGLLRDRLEYSGIIITDAMDMDAVDTIFSPEEAAVQAVIAGNDMLILAAHISPERQVSAMQAVIDAVNAGIIDESQVDTSIHHILEAKQLFGILDWKELDPASAEERIQAEVHYELVQKMFEAGITIVNGEEMLPLTGNIVMVYPASRQSLHRECQVEGWTEIGVSDYPTEAEITWAHTAAQQADVTIVFTSNVAENPQQRSLVGALPAQKTMVIAMWSPYDMLYLPPVAGYMVIYSPLQQANTAICAILQGNALPRGTLVVSYDS